MKTGVGGFQARRLTQAREALGLNRVALASLINVSGATISNWENGKQVPQENKLVALSLALAQPVNWFLNEPVIDEIEKPYFFRSLSAALKVGMTSTKTKLDWLEEISVILGHYLEWPTLNLPESKKDFNALSDEDIESFAMDFRERLGYADAPIGNLLLAAESAGVICARVDVGYDKLDGVSRWNRDLKRPYVLLSNDKENGVRSRFDIAHELGHIVLHKHVDWKLVNKSDVHKELERQANLFASSLLLPASSFAKDVSSSSIDMFLALKPKWKVSIAAMVFRAHQLGIISDLQKSNLFKSLSARRWRIKEPYDDKVLPEIPRLLNRSVNMLLEAGLSKDVLLNKLSFEKNTLQSLCALPDGFFDEEEDVNLIRLKPQVRSSSSSISSDSTAQVLKFGK